MSSRLDRLKQLKAAQAAQRGSVGGDDASSVGGNVIPGPPPPPRNPDGTLITNQNGIDSYGPAPPPFEPAAPRTSLYVRLPVLLHEAEGSVIGAADPSLVWGVSLWDGPNRLTCDVHTAVSPPREPDTPPRILRLDVLLPNLAQFTLRLEVFKESALNFAIASSKLAVYLFPAPQSRPASTMIPISSKSGQKATSTLLASSSVSLTPYTSSAVNILLLSSEDGRPALLAPFDLTLIHTRMFRPSLSFPSAPCAPLCPLDFLLPGRSEVMITVEGVRGGEGPDASPPLSIVAVLAKGNGEALVGPVSLGAAKWQRGYVYPTPAPSTGPSSRLSSAENTPSRASVGRNRFSSLGSEDGAPGVPSASA